MPERTIVLTPTERQVQELLVQAARLLGYRVYHTWLSARSAPGFPDLILVRPPALIALECKSARGRLTADQRAWLADLEACGVVAHVVRPHAADDAISLDDALALLARCAGQNGKQIAAAIGVHRETVYSWRRRDEAMIEVANLDVTVFVRAGELGQILATLARRDRTEAELALSTQIAGALTRRRYRDSQVVVLQMPAHQAALLVVLARDQGVSTAFHPDVQEALRALAEAES